MAVAPTTTTTTTTTKLYQPRGSRLDNSMISPLSHPALSVRSKNLAASFHVKLELNATKLWLRPRLYCSTHYSNKPLFPIFVPPYPIPSHPIPSHLISSHPISSHLTSVLPACSASDSTRPNLVYQPTYRPTDLPTYRPTDLPTYLRRYLPTYLLTDLPTEYLLKEHRYSKALPTPTISTHTPPAYQAPSHDASLTCCCIIPQPGPCSLLHCPINCLRSPRPT